MTKKTFTDNEIINAYETCSGIWTAAKSLGTYGQLIHRRLKKINYPIRDVNFLTEKEKIEIIKLYKNNGDSLRNIDLNKFSQKIGRSKSSICRFAKKMNLTKIGRKMTKEQIEKLSNNLKEHFKKNNHPRGMLGKKHSMKTRDIFSQIVKERNANMTDEQKSNISLKALKTKMEKYGSISVNRAKTTWKSGWRNIGGQEKFYRSRWEANYARYLEYLKCRHEIKGWSHEPKCFWFDKIKRGTRSYLPDFEVIKNDNSIEYHEVKGWMDDRSKTKISRMKKYYPNEKLIIISKNEYEIIKKTHSHVINGWE